VTMNRILLLRHMAGDGDDRVARALRARGDAVFSCTPALGDRLPDAAEVDAVVCYGGVQSANDTAAVPYLARETEWIRRWVGEGRPYFGICLGAQLLARALGGEVARHPQDLFEIGFGEVRPVNAGDSFLPRTEKFFQWHQEGFTPPPGARLLARGAVFANQAFAVDEKIIGVQFHPEVTRHMLLRWQREAAHMLQRPEAHSAARQLADWERHHENVRRWLGGFLERWRGGGEGAGRGVGWAA